MCCHLHNQVLSVKLTNLNSVFVFCVLPKYKCVHIETFFKVIIDSFIVVLYPSPCLKPSLKVNLKNDDFCPVSIHCVSSFLLFMLKTQMTVGSGQHSVQMQYIQLKWVPFLIESRKENIPLILYENKKIVD